jgi:large subunit ribosomal protein L30
MTKSEIKTIGKIRVMQVASTISRPNTQKKTLLGLGLRKIGSERILDNTSSIQGMVKKVKHLISVEAV